MRSKERLFVTTILLAIVLWGITGAAFAKLPAPKNVVATKGDFLDRICITWDPVGMGATSYRIFRAEVGKSYSSIGVYTEKPPFKFCDTKNLVTNVDYRYGIAAIDKQGLDGDRGEDTGYVKRFPAPQLTKLDNSTGGHMKLYWKAMGAMPGGSNYKLYRSVTEQNSPAGTPQPLITIPAPTTTYDDANIATFKLYYYWVSVISPTGFESPKSNELHALGLPVPAPALPPPPGLKAEQIVGPSVKVSWGTSIPTGGTAADTKQYLLDITYWANAKDPSPTSKRRETLKGTQLTYTISTVRAGHRYAFQVIAVNADGKQSAPSNIVELVVK